VAKEPYREPTPVRPRDPKPKGPTVTRAADPNADARSPRRVPQEDPDARSPRRVPQEESDAGVFSGLVSPHPSSNAIERAGQIALTLVGLPLILTTFLVVGWFDTRRAARDAVQSGSTDRAVSIAHPVAWLIGAAPLGLLAFARQMSPLFIAFAIGIPYVALLLRRWLRRSVEERALLERLMTRKR
jgi:hypothetical protein